MKDKNGIEIKIGMDVITPDPDETDTYIHSFQGDVIDIDDPYVIVRDGDGDCFSIEPERLELITTNEA